MKKIIIGLMNLLGLIGLGTLTYTIWTAMKEGGENWEIPVSFNKSGEGKFEITMITSFLILYLIGMSYLTVSSVKEIYNIRKKAKMKANNIFEQLSLKSQQKYKNLLKKLNSDKKWEQQKEVRD